MNTLPPAQVTDGDGCQFFSVWARVTREIENASPSVTAGSLRERHCDDRLAMCAALVFLDQR
jgi:hypothetical protein